LPTIIRISAVQANKNLIGALHNIPKADYFRILLQMESEIAAKK
jgi:hypothetical protein